MARYRHYHSVDHTTERDTDNNKIIALLRAGTDMMMMTTARQVLHVFARSERVYNDFDIALKHTDRFVENFAVRQWYTHDRHASGHPSVVRHEERGIYLYVMWCGVDVGPLDRIPLDVTLEFRSFVVNDQLCAVTQYSNLVYVPLLVRHYDAIITRIHEFFNHHVKTQLSATNGNNRHCTLHMAHNA